MKDEAKGFPTAEFDGLKSKMYSCVKEDEAGYKKVEETKKDVIKFDGA